MPGSMSTTVWDAGGGSEAAKVVTAAVTATLSARIVARVAAITDGFTAQA